MNMTVNMCNHESSAVIIVRCHCLLLSSSEDNHPDHNFKDRDFKVPLRLIQMKYEVIT